MQLKTEFEFSSGGLVIDNGRVLLIKTKSMGGGVIHTFPKGKVEKGETFEEAAIREVEEETGYSCIANDYLGDKKYTYIRDSKMIIKKVKWFKMSSDMAQGDFDHEEVDETLWAKKDTALSILSYQSDKELLKKVLN